MAAFNQQANLGIHGVQMHHKTMREDGFMARGSLPTFAESSSHCRRMPAIDSSATWPLQKQRSWRKVPGGGDKSQQFATVMQRGLWLLGYQVCSVGKLTNLTGGEPFGRGKLGIQRSLLFSPWQLGIHGVL